MQSAAGFVGNEGQVPDTDHEERCQDSILHQIRQKKFEVSGRDAGGIAGVSSDRLSDMTDDRMGSSVVATAGRRVMLLPDTSTMRFRDKEIGRASCRERV